MSLPKEIRTERLRLRERRRFAAHHRKGTIDEDVILLKERPWRLERAGGGVKKFGGPWIWSE